MTRIRLQWTDDNPIYGRTTYMDRAWSVDTLLLSDHLGGREPSIRMYLHRAGQDDRAFEQRVDYPVINWDREHGRYPEWADIDDGIGDTDEQPAMGTAKRIWLTWDNDKASSLIDGRIWDVELEPPEAGGMLGLNLMAWGSIIRKVVVNRDMEHGMHPEWVDCESVEDHALPPLETAMHDAGLAAVEFFRNEIRENGIMRRLRPVAYAGDQGLAVAPEMPRHQVEFTMTLGDPPQEELHGHIADMHMPTREQLEQGIRGMQATAELPEGEAGRIREWIEHRIVDSVRENATTASSTLARMAEDQDLSPETRAVAWSMLSSQSDVMSRVFNTQPQATAQDADQARLMQEVDRLMRDPDIQDAALCAGMAREEMRSIVADVVQAEARRAIVSDDQYPLVWYPVPQQITIAWGQDEQA